MARGTCPYSCRRVFECQNVELNIAEAVHIYEEKRTACRGRPSVQTTWWLRGRGMIKLAFHRPLSGLDCSGG